MKIDPTLYVTVGHAAGLSGVSRLCIRNKAKAGILPAVCIDGIWFVLRTAAVRFKPHPTKGRPRKSDASRR